jgi:tetratricopeptide (TPR) repeat protein
LRQEELCEGICSVSQLSKIETGKAQAKDELIQAIAKRLGVSLKQLQSNDARREQLEQEMKFAIQASKTNHDQKAIALIQKVIEESQAHGYRDIYVEAVYQQSHFYDNLGDWPQVIRLSKEVLTSGTELEPGILIDLWGQLGAAYHFTGRLRDAFRCYSQQEDLIDGISPDHPNALRIYNGYVANQFNMRRYREALYYGERAYPLAVSSQRHIMRWRVANAIALSLNRLREQPERRYELLESSLQEAEQNGHIAEASIYANNLGTLHYWDERYELAQHYQELCIRYAELVSDVYIDMYRREPYYELALIFVRTGQFAQAEQILDQLRPLCENRSEAFLYNARIPRIEAEIAGARGQWEQQVAHLETALAVYEQYQVYLEAEETAVLLAEVWERQGNLAQSLQMYRQAIEYQKKMEEDRRTLCKIGTI